MRGDRTKSDVVKDTYRTYEMGMEADQDARKVKLKEDGNVTRQVLEAIGFETLQSEKSETEESKK